MPRFNVEGADLQTGQERVIQVDAPDAATAEQVARDRGMLVASVFESTARPQLGELDALAEAARGSRGAAAASPPPALAYAAPVQLPALPDYFGLRVGRTVLMIFAGVYYAVGLLILGLAIYGSGYLASQRTRTALDTAALLLMLLYSFASISVGGLFHALSAACHALRDIARNSWRT